MSIEIKDLADELGTDVTSIKNWLRDSGYSRPDRVFRGSAASLDRDEEHAVRAAYESGALKRNRTRREDVRAEAPPPDPVVSSADVDDLPPAIVDEAAFEARGTEAYPIYVHEELLRWLNSDHTPAGQRRIVTRRIQELMAHGRATQMKGVKGKNRGWLRTPVGGNGGFQFYLWLVNYGELVGGQEAEAKALHARVPQGSRLLRAVRHHDETKDLLDVGSLDDYLPLTAAQALSACEDGLAEPLVDAQRTAVCDRARVRVLVGQPGAGKTTSLQASVSSLSGRALYVTWSQDLAARAREWFAAFAPAELDIEVWTFRDMLARVDPARSVGADLTLSKAVDLLRARLEPFAGQLGPWRRERTIRAAELFAELHAHLIGAALPVAFRARGACDEPRLAEQDYRIMRAAIGDRALDAALLAVRKLQEDDVRQLFPGPVAAFERAQDLQRGALSLDPNVFAFDWVLVDEVQDLTLAEQWLLVDVAARSGRTRGVNPGMIVAGDEAQTVRPTAFEFGPLSDLLVDRIGARTDRRQHELVENLRSPEAIAAVLDRARRALYGSLPRAQRPRGRRDVGPTEVTVGRVMEVATRDDDDLRRVLEVFAAVPGEAALVYPGALVPDRLRALAEEIDAVLWTSETIKGLEFRIVGVLDVPTEVKHIEDLVQGVDREPLAIELARTATDRFLVALSRATETLVLVGEAWEGSVALDQIVLASGIDEGGTAEGEERPREGHLGVVGVAELATLLDVDATDAVSRVDALLVQSERLGALGDHDSAVRLAENAVGLLGRSGRAGAAGRDLRRRAYRRFGQAQVLAAVVQERLVLLAYAARAFRAADAKDTAATTTSLHGALTRTRADTEGYRRLENVAASISRLANDEPGLVDHVVTRLRAHAEAIAAEGAVPPEPAGRAAALRGLALLAARAPSDRDAFHRAHQTLLASVLRVVGASTEKGRRAEYAALRAGLEDASTLAILDAKHAEANGELDQAAALWERAGRLDDALRCVRGIPDLNAATRLATDSRADDAPVLTWARELELLLARKPEGRLESAELVLLRARAEAALVGVVPTTTVSRVARGRRG